VTAVLLITLITTAVCACHALTGATRVWITPISPATNAIPDSTDRLRAIGLLNRVIALIGALLTSLLPTDSAHMLLMTFYWILTSLK